MSSTSTITRYHRSARDENEPRPLELEREIVKTGTIPDKLRYPSSRQQSQNGMSMHTTQDAGDYHGHRLTNHTLRDMDEDVDVTVNASQIFRI